MVYTRSPPPWVPRYATFPFGWIHTSDGAELRAWQAADHGDRCAHITFAHVDRAAGRSIAYQRGNRERTHAVRHEPAIQCQLAIARRERPGRCQTGDRSARSVARIHLEAHDITLSHRVLLRRDRDLRDVIGDDANIHARACGACAHGKLRLSGANARDDTIAIDSCNGRRR